MNGAKKAWLLTASLTAALVVTGVLVRQFESTVRAADNPVTTGSFLMNTTEGEAERLILVDTQAKSIMVYRTQNCGQFRLVGARSYEFDLELKDTSRSEEIELKGGITYLRAYELYQESLKKKAQ